jgi:hypothetical protein
MAIAEQSLLQTRRPVLLAPARLQSDLRMMTSSARAYVRPINRHSGMLRMIATIVQAA